MEITESHSREKWSYTYGLCSTLFSGKAFRVIWVLPCFVLRDIVDIEVPIVNLSGHLLFSRLPFFRNPPSHTPVMWT